MTLSDARPTMAEPGRLGVARCALTGAVVVSVLFALCWLTSLFGAFGGSHMYMAMFAMGASAPLAALALGLICSAAAGLFVGALTALTYNAFGFLARG